MFVMLNRMNEKCQYFRPQKVTNAGALCNF